MLKSIKKFEVINVADDILIVQGEPATGKTYITNLMDPRKVKLIDDIYAFDKSKVSEILKARTTGAKQFWYGQYEIDPRVVILIMNSPVLALQYTQEFQEQIEKEKERELRAKNN